MNKVESLFVGKTINRNGITLYSKVDAIKFINESRKENISILGIDGFYLTASTIQPSLENSIDFSSKSFLGSSFEEAKNFLIDKDNQLYFEIICSE